MCDMHCCCFPLIFKEATQEKCICGHYEFVEGLIKRAEASEAKVEAADGVSQKRLERIRVLEAALLRIRDECGDVSRKAARLAGDALAKAATGPSEGGK